MAIGRFKRFDMVIETIQRKLPFVAFSEHSAHEIIERAKTGILVDAILQKNWQTPLLPYWKTIIIWQKWGKPVTIGFCPNY